LLAKDGVWTPLDISGPAPCLPKADGGLAELAATTSRPRSPVD